VGAITVELKGVNDKRNRANLVLVVEDKRLDEKNRNVNQPIFFYMNGARQPQELVINKMGKNQISGYLSTPKANAQPGANTAAAKSGN